MPPEELSACCKVYPFFVMDHKWTGNPDSGLHCLLSGSRQARTTPHHKKSPAETGLRAELEGIGGTPKRARNNRLPRHCGKKMPRFEAGLRRVSQHGSFVPRRQDNPRKQPWFQCSIVCRIYSPSGDAFLSPGLSSDRISICSHYNNQLASEFPGPERKSKAMDDLTSGQEEAVAATVGAIQRIAMAIVELPTEGRAAHYAMVSRKFEAVMMEVGIEGATAHAWLNSTMHGIESLVSEIEAGGGAAGGTS